MLRRCSRRLRSHFWDCCGRRQGIWRRLQQHACCSMAWVLRRCTSLLSVTSRNEHCQGLLPLFFLSVCMCGVRSLCMHVCGCLLRHCGAFEIATSGMLHAPSLAQQTCAPTEIL